MKFALSVGVGALSMAFHVSAFHIRTHAELIDAAYLRSELGPAGSLTARLGIVDVPGSLGTRPRHSPPPSRVKLGAIGQVQPRSR